MNPPTTYAEWAACCDLLLKGENDDENLAAMQAGRLEWTSGVAERITRRIYEVLDVRLKAAGEQFQRDTSHARGHETLLANALLDIRRKLVPLVRLAALSALPDMVKDSLRQSLQQFAERTQASLESSAQADRTGRLLDIVKRNRVRMPDIEDATKPAAQPDTPTGCATANGSRVRRIILNR